MKLCVIVVPDADGDRLLGRLAEVGLGSTRVGSSGGFLRRGSVTVLSAVQEHRVSELVNLLREEFPEVTEEVPIAAIPFVDEWDYTARSMNVRVGGAVLFVLNLARFERV